MGGKRRGRGWKEREERREEEDEWNKEEKRRRKRRWEADAWLRASRKPTKTTNLATRQNHMKKKKNIVYKRKEKLIFFFNYWSSRDFIFAWFLRNYDLSVVFFFNMNFYSFSCSLSRGTTFTTWSFCHWHVESTSISLLSSRNKPSC